MISVDEALARLFDLVAPLPAETVPLRAASGRVLARELRAARTQPPFPASAMDGYAVRGAEVRPGAAFRVIGEAPAGTAFPGAVGPGEAVRIFTGAPVPEGADRVVIQEDTDADGDRILLRDTIDDGPYIRPAGCDFAEGTPVPPGLFLGPSEVALLAAMNHPEIPVHRTPEVAIICTGDELVMPGETPRPDQIIASNGFGLAALVEREGARARLLPIASDTPEALNQAFDMAEGADVVLTCGGASVGDHDLVAGTLAARGVKLDFHKVAMRPGKPLMAGRMGDAILIGLPGNPVSTMVCGVIFVLPVLRALMGAPAQPARREVLPLAEALPSNGKREHYMRATRGPDGVAALSQQDSSLLSVLAGADLLIRRPVHDPARIKGELVETIPL